MALQHTTATQPETASYAKRLLSFMRRAMSTVHPQLQRWSSRRLRLHWQIICYNAYVSACACRYDSIVSSILELLSFRHGVPAAMFEHVVTERPGSGPGTPPAQSRRFVAGPGRGAETIDLLMCAASVGSVSTTQILVDCGAPRVMSLEHERWLYFACFDSLRSQRQLPGQALLD